MQVQQLSFVSKDKNKTHTFLAVFVEIETELKIKAHSAQNCGSVHRSDNQGFQRSFSLKSRTHWNPKMQLFEGRL